MSSHKNHDQHDHRASPRLSCSFSVLMFIPIHRARFSLLVLCGLQDNWCLIEHAEWNVFCFWRFTVNDVFLKMKFFQLIKLF